MKYVAILWCTVGLFFSPFARAGVFNIPQFVEPGKFAAGLEPELVLTSGAGVGADLKVTQGLSELLNVQGYLGTGSGPHRFRVGGSLTFDFFPDVDKQPGIGLSAGAGYHLRKDYGQMELTGTPYIHKELKGQETTVDPFIAVPFGWGFHGGRYDVLSSVNFGGNFKANDHFRYIVELAIGISHRESAVSGGVVYYQ